MDAHEQYRGRGVQPWAQEARARLALLEVDELLNDERPEEADKEHERHGTLLLHTRSEVVNASVPGVNTTSESMVAPTAGAATPHSWLNPARCPMAMRP